MLHKYASSSLVLLATLACTPCVAASQFVRIRTGDSSRVPRVRQEIAILTNGDWDDDHLAERVATRLAKKLAPARLTFRVSEAGILNDVRLPDRWMGHLGQLREFLRIDGFRMALALVRDAADQQRVTVFLLPLDESDVRVVGTWPVGGYETAATAIAEAIGADSSFQRVRANVTAPAP